MPDVGEKAPDFTLRSDEGREVSIRDLRGKKIVLYFYPKDGTSGCTQEAIEFRDLADRFTKQGVVILGVSKDSIESHQRFKEKHRLPFTLLSDPKAVVMNLYGVWKQRSLYGRNFMGTERTTFIIDEEGTIQKIYRKVNVRDHAKTCLLNLSEI